MFIQVGGYWWNSTVYLADIDDEDVGLVEEYKWTPLHIRNTIYARTSAKSNKPEILLHRLIMGLKPGDKRQVNHINGDGLDNRRCNLEICDAMYNTQSFRKVNSTCGIGNITIRKKCTINPYEGRIRLNKKCYYKSFPTEAEARDWINTLVEEEKQKSSRNV